MSSNVSGQGSAPVRPAQIHPSIIDEVADANLAEGKIVEKSAGVFAGYPDIIRPKVAWRWFNTSNLSRETGFFKYFKYAGQILKRVKEDKYLDFRAAVDAFNGNKTEENLDRVIKQITLLKDSRSSDLTDETVRQVGNQLVLYKFEMARDRFEENSFRGFCPLKSRQISDLDTDFIGADRDVFVPLAVAIELYNEDQHPTAEQFSNIISKLVDLNKTHPKEFRENTRGVERVLYELSSALVDPKLSELFMLLRSDGTILAHKRIEGLQKSVENSSMLFKNRSIDQQLINIPRVNIFFSMSGLADKLNSSIAKFNANKTQLGLLDVVNELREFQFAHNGSYLNSNASKVIDGVNKLLAGETKQGKIRSTNDYQLLVTTKEQINVKGIETGSKWNAIGWDFHTWKSLPLPKLPQNRSADENISTITAWVKDLNHAIRDRSKDGISPKELLNNLIASLDEWVTTAPDDFKRSGGDKLLKALSKNIVGSISNVGLGPLLVGDTDLVLSEGMKSLNLSIQNYNKSRSEEGLREIKDCLGKVQKNEPAQYEKFHLAKVLSQVDKTDPLKPIALPSSHLEQVFEHTMSFRQEEGVNAYLMIFHNPVLPWSHSEIGFVDGVKSIRPETFGKDYITHQKGVFEAALSEKPITDILDRQYLEDVDHFVMEPHLKRSHQDFRPPETLFDDGDPINREELIQYGDEVFTLLQKKGIFDVWGEYNTEFQIDDIRGLLSDLKCYSDKEIDFIVSRIPPPIDPEKLPEMVAAAKSAVAYEALREGEIFDETGQVKGGISYETIYKILESAFGKNSAFINTVGDLVTIEAGSTFNAQSFIPFAKSDSEALYKFLNDKAMIETKISSDVQNHVYLKADWEKVLQASELPEPLKGKMAAVICKLRGIGVAGQIVKREYAGIGADQEGLESLSHHAEGVRLTDKRLVARLEKLCRRRKNEIQNNMNIFGAIKGGLRSLVKGKYATLLVTQEDKVRHFRQALIDNFLTTVSPRSFLPDLEEPRFRLELHESGGVVFERWIEDPNGQFSRVKNPSPVSKNQSAEHMEDEYKHNHYSLDEKGHLKSIKKEVKEKEGTQERGNLIYKSNGEVEWKSDKKNGQYFKAKGAAASEAVRDERPLYSAKSFEKYLSNNETEWCGSYMIRMLHGAYAHECMPEFETVLKQMQDDFKEITGFKGELQFERRHAEMLFAMASSYAQRIVDSKAGQKYFRDMNPSIKMSSRCTPDMIHEFLMGKTAGIVNSMRRGWKTIQIPESRDFKPEGIKAKVLVGAAKVGLGIVAIPFALLKTAYNVISAVWGFFVNIGLSGVEAAKAKHAELQRLDEAGTIKRWHKVRATAAFVKGMAVDGVAKPIARSVREIYEIARNVFVKKGETAFSKSLS